MTLADRRSLLKSLGIAVPASLLTATVPKNSPVTPEEVFTLYVSESVRLLPHIMGEAAGDRDSVLRQLIEVQGAALALVLVRLQQV